MLTSEPQPTITGDAAISVAAQSPRPAGHTGAVRDSLNSRLWPATSDRVLRSLALREHVAGTDCFVPTRVQADNGDETRYADKSATYTKGLLQTRIGLVDLAAYRSFTDALGSGDPPAFERIVLGGSRRLNGPQGGLAFALDCLDSAQVTSPPAPALAGEAYAAELIELYWASLLRDVAFTDYATDPTAARAAAELSSLPSYAGPRDQSGAVTTGLLFRGTFAGESVGPYVSQFLVQPTAFGALPITQRYNTNVAGVDFMLDPGEFLAVQNGQPTGRTLTMDPASPLYIRDGRGLAAYTHEDVLYQAYLIASLIAGSLAVPVNPGNPYARSATQIGSATLGGPDMSAGVAAVAAAALRSAWYQKWWVHLRHRPESGGAIVHLQKTGQADTIEGHISDTVLQSEALAATEDTHQSYLLAQAFPEGSPTHPAYPTGHGAVAGACITVLKFFLDGAFTIPSDNLLVAAPDGQSTVAYAPPAGEPPLTVNGELHKLASNISFGHGVHAGIHWRSDTDASIRLGEAVALSYLRDQAMTYNERFAISLTKLDGTAAIISNA